MGEIENDPLHATIEESVQIDSDYVRSAIGSQRDQMIVTQFLIRRPDSGFSFEALIYATFSSQGRRGGSRSQKTAPAANVS